MNYFGVCFYIEIEMSCVHCAHMFSLSYDIMLIDIQIFNNSRPIDYSFVLPTYAEKRKKAISHIQKICLIYQHPRKHRIYLSNTAFAC